MAKEYRGYRLSDGTSCVLVGTAEQLRFLNRDETRWPLVRLYEVGRDPTGDLSIQKEVPPPVLESPAGGHVGKPYCLPRRWDLRRYSECFDWATAGPGAMQLAIAMLADHVGPAHVDDAVNRHEEFARVVVAALPQVQWTLHEREISFFLNVDIES